ncbi:MAG: hypothetical protein M5T52_23825 [Ignavibacteriaceae bacterium]|nr:hypothetical protein [Ignavibacteriaceae bacterium]
MSKHIWRKQIIDRNFIENSKRSVFEDFLLMSAGMMLKDIMH